MSPHILIIDLRFTPGNWQHMESLYHCLKEQKIGSSFILADEFTPFLAAQSKTFPAKYAGASKGIASLIEMPVSYVKLTQSIRSLEGGTHALFVNWHPLNRSCIKKLKKRFPSIQISLWLHEPYIGRKEDHGIFKYSARKIIRIIQNAYFHYVDRFILFSTHSLSLFKTHVAPELKHRYTTHQIPLLYRDLCPEPNTIKRKYITYFGNIAQIKRFDTFIGLARKMLDYNFRLVTSSSVPKDLYSIPNLEIIQKKNLSDEEIAANVSESIACFALYKSGANSGVVPVALMCGAPILASRIKVFENYGLEHQSNCVFIDNVNDANEIREAMELIKKNLDVMSKAARQSYLTTFDDHKCAEYYPWLF